MLPRRVRANPIFGCFHLLVLFEFGISKAGHANCKIPRFDSNHLRRHALSRGLDGV